MRLIISVFYCVLLKSDNAIKTTATFHHNSIIYCTHMHIQTKADRGGVIAEKLSQKTATQLLCRPRWRPLTAVVVANKNNN